jgi:hypothetical protein
MKPKRLKELLFAAILMLIPGFVIAQEVIIDGEFRPRMEYRDGYCATLTDDKDPGLFTIQRTRLGLSFKNFRLKTRLTLQDSRTWGESGTNSEAVASSGATSIYEAWAELILTPGFSCQIGRQPLKYDDNRLFSASTWSNTGNAHDLALMKYAVANFQSNYGIAFNNDKAISSETAYSSAMKYRFMQFLWLSQNFNNGVTITAIGVDEGIQATTTDVKKMNMYHTYTIGGNVGYANEKCPVSFLATAYFQAGKSSTTHTDANATVNRDDLSGYFTALKINYKILKNASLSLAADYFSGDDNTADSNCKTFKKLYGSDHSFNGYMDYWSTLDTWGLTDYSVTARLGSDKKLMFETAYHYFNAAEKFNTNRGKALGSELDLTLTYVMDNTITIQGGWSTYFDNDNTKLIKNKSANASVRFPQWAYIMLNIKPQYIKSIIQ